MRKLQIGVMGSAGDTTDRAKTEHLEGLASRLGKAIVASGNILVTGATTGLPGLVTKIVQELGGLSIGVSPAESPEAHLETGKEIVDTALVCTGFGLKGRNVINIRSSELL